MDSIRSVVDDAQGNERELLKDRAAQVPSDERRIVGIAVATTFLSTLLRIAIVMWRRHYRSP